ncbi:BSD domain containing protein [Parasponia andersonii]|uniref:BSD domain containing protein n=1 Tax=Parasponia andersonii TaxID=3476 RepID=A0A2P5DBX9_PARAD|nr:BSD domain containing protein [Parasponia andersonii]
MDVSSWFRRSLTRSTKKTKNPEEQPKQRNEYEDQILGVTDKLIDYVKSFTLDTFRNFPLSGNEEARCGDDSATTSGNVRTDLSEWQERHATLVLSKVKEISQLRYKLCPGYLKEHQFWRIYFSLVKSHVAEYELHALRLAKIKEIALKNGKLTEMNACEVEMAETKNAANLPPPTP